VPVRSRSVSGTTGPRLRDLHAAAAGGGGVGEVRGASHPGNVPVAVRPLNARAYCASTDAQRPVRRYIRLHRRGGSAGAVAWLGHFRPNLDAGVVIDAVHVRVTDVPGHHAGRSLKISMRSMHSRRIPAQPGRAVLQPSEPTAVRRASRIFPCCSWSADGDAGGRSPHAGAVEHASVGRHAGTGRATGSQRVAGPPSSGFKSGSSLAARCRGSCARDCSRSAMRADG
jgi:hypothetical protein